MHRLQIGVRPCPCSGVGKPNAGQVFLSPHIQLQSGRGAVASRRDLSAQAEGKFFVGGNWKCNGETLLEGNSVGLTSYAASSVMLM